MKLRAMWFSAVAVVLGAIFWRMLHEQLVGINLDVLAVVLMLAGATGLAASSVISVISFFRRRGPVRRDSSSLTMTKSMTTTMTTTMSTTTSTTTRDRLSPSAASVDTTPLEHVDLDIVRPTRERRQNSPSLQMPSS